MALNPTLFIDRVDKSECRLLLETHDKSINYPLDKNAAKRIVKILNDYVTGDNKHAGRSYGVIQN